MMIFTFYLLINIIVIFSFFKHQTKHLCKLELLLYWMIGSLFFQNYSAFNYMNLKTIIIPEVLSLEMVHFMNRILLFPVLIVWFLNQFSSVSQRGKKLALVVSFVFILFGLEWLAENLGVLNHKAEFWKLWSLSFWITAILLSIGAMNIFRRKLIKGV